MISADRVDQIGEIVIVNIKEEPTILDEAPQGDPLACAEHVPGAEHVKSEGDVLSNKGQLTSTVNTPGEKPYSCHECDYRAVRLAHLKRHMRIHTVTESNEPYHTVAVLKGEMMIKDVPFAEGRVVADGLQDDLTTSSCSSTSQANNSDIKDGTGSIQCVKLLTCVICDHKAAYHSQLMTHLRTHTGERPFACDRCDYRAARLSLLKAHTRTHTSESYTCDLCDYRTGHFNKLQIHKSTHSDETPYACDSCDYRAKYLNHLKQHMRTHTGEKPYACDTCDYRARQLGTLKAHMRIHTGEKPYSCDSCDYKTAYPNALRRHRRAHKVFCCPKKKSLMKSDSQVEEELHHVDGIEVLRE